MLAPRLTIKLFKVGGKDETWHKNAFRDGEVKLIRSHAKMYVKTIWGGDLLLSSPMTACHKKSQISAFRIHKMSNANVRHLKRRNLSCWIML